MYGTGWGSKVSQLLQEQDHEVAGIWGYNQKELDTVANELNIPFKTHDKDELLKEVQENQHNLVWVATPPFMLTYVTKEILAHRTNVVVEAPAASCEAEVEELYNKACSFPTVMCRVAYQLRCLPGARELHRLIRENTYGRVVCAEVKVQCSQAAISGKKYGWKHDKDRGGGALAMFGCHIIDLLVFLFEEQVVSVQGKLFNFVPETKHVNGFRQITGDDLCHFQLKFKSGIVALVQLNMLHPETVFKQVITIVTEQASLVLDNCDISINPPGNFKNTIPKEKPLPGAADPGAPIPYLIGMRHFIKTLNSELNALPSHQSSKSPLENAWHVLSVIEVLKNHNEDDDYWLPVNCNPIKSRDKLRP